MHRVADTPRDITGRASHTPSCVVGGISRILGGIPHEACSTARGAVSHAGSFACTSKQRRPAAAHKHPEDAHADQRGGNGILARCVSEILNEVVTRRGKHGGVIEGRGYPRPAS